MMNLGTFLKDPLSGKLEGYLFGINIMPTKLSFHPLTSENGKKYYQIFATCPETTVHAGFAWVKTSQNEGKRPYLDVKLDSPGLPRTLYAKLMESHVIPNQFHILWNEPESPKVNATAEQQMGNRYSALSPLV